MTQDDGPYLIDAYVYELAQAGCDDEHNGNGWYGLLSGGLDVSATTDLDIHLSDREKKFLADQAGAIVREHPEATYRVTYYADKTALDAAWRTMTAGAKPSGPKPEL